MPNYQTSIDLLEELQRLGMTDAAYRVLRETTPYDTINAHLKYCAEDRNMARDGQSERIQKRLRLIRDAHVLARFMSNDPRLFVALAEAAVIEIPKPLSSTD